MQDIIEPALSLSVSLARQAGRILTERFEKGVDVELKGHIDPVTEVDRQVERFLAERISGEFPDHEILAEEGTRSEGAGEYRWVIDPLDGTTNYAHGYPCYAVSIALEFRRETLLGVIYQPALDEMFTAVRGAGAFLNGRRLAVSSRVTDLGEAFLVTGVPYSLHEPEVLRRNVSRLERFLAGSFAVRRDGSAAYDLACLAAGRFDGYWEEGLKSWDTAAGVLMVLEAGGIATDFNGEPYLPDTSHSILAAASEGLHRQMLGMLNER
ncbi:MAG: inositol monophosphatase [Candidatus Glassbacteria bacterium]|nr:inositol monophosphatase [Candidatus Glassbacteria bacterium]